MKKKSSKKFLAKHLVIFTIAIIPLVIYGFSRNDSQEDTTEDITEDIAPEALNHLLSNSLSDTTTTENLDKQIGKFIRQWEIKGASLAVMKDEKLIYAKGYGWADQENNEKTEVKHIFRIASLSKLITSVTIMKLMEDGLLNLNDKVFGIGGHLNYPQFSEFKDKRLTKITIEHLLRHKGGFTTRAGDPLFSLSLVSRRLGLERAVEREELIKYVISRRLGFTPGTETSYSNIGYLLLSMIVEEVTGVEYEQYIKTNILFPNGIYDMHIAHNFYHEKYPNEVRYYEPSNEQPITPYDLSDTLLPRCYGGNNIRLLSGAGAWVASPVELLKFVSMIDGRDNVTDILSKESISIMTKSAPSTLPIGWAKCHSSGDWTRTGTLSGSSALIKYNSNGYSWVFITNTSSWKGSTFPRNIERFFRGAMQKVSEWPQKDLFDFRTQTSNQS